MGEQHSGRPSVLTHTSLAQRPMRIGDELRPHLSSSKYPSNIY